MVSFNLNPRNNQLPCEPKVSTWLLYILLNNLSPRLRRCSCVLVVCSSLKPCSGTDLAGVDLKRTEKPETAWQDKPGKSRTVIGGGGGGVLTTIASIFLILSCVSICKKPLFYLFGCVQPRYKGKNMYTAVALALAW